MALEFTYPPPEFEAQIISSETGLPAKTADTLVRFAIMTRQLTDAGLTEGASTRLLIHTGLLINNGIDPRTACRVSISQALTDDTDLLASINEMVSALF